MIDGGFLSYIRIDFKRAFISFKLLVGIVGVIILLMIAALEGINLQSDVLYVVSLVMMGLPAMVILVFGAFTFGTSLYEDCENKYITLEVIRGNLFKYTLSKVITIFTTSVFTIAFGILGFAIVLKFFLPWVDLDGNTYQHLVLGGGFRNILKNQNYVMYFLLYGIQFGIASGIMSLLAAYVSLFIQSKTLILSIPMIGFYFIDFFRSEILPNTPNLHLIFNAQNNVFNNDLKAFMLVVVIGLISFVLLFLVILRKLKRRIQNG